ncbi:MAG: TGS domain-containing protein [Planctomycetes bacterium]|nr:TGS domain-containing protein [Planctomycetota bacterium]
MPANLTPMYLKAEEGFRQAKTVAEKIAALEEMSATIPKHKGTEKMRADIRRRLAKLREAGEKAKGRSGIDAFYVEKHGAGQFVLIGTPNCGKSALVGALTKAHVTVAPYPFSTHGPVPGMMNYEDVQVQLVDMPPVTAEGFVPGMIGAVRNADGLIICIDLAADVLQEMDICLGLLDARGLVPPGRPAPEGGAAKRMLIVGTKLDVPGAAENFQALRELYRDVPMLATSAEKGDHLGEIPRMCFRMLDVVRIYSKEPGKPPDKDRPFVLPRGSTVLDLAAAIHKDMATSLKRARIWGANTYEGAPAPRDHVLSDRDIVELHV